MLSIDSFLERVGRAAVDMAHACAHQTQDRLIEHLDESGEPRTVDVKIGDRTIKVPTVTIAPPSVMLPEELTIELDSDVVLPSERSEKGVTLTFRSVEDSPASHIKVSVRLKRQRPHEAMEQLRDRLVSNMTNTIYDPPAPPPQAPTSVSAERELGTPGF